jgi:hypothetical protein
MGYFSIQQKEKCYKDSGKKTTYDQVVDTIIKDVPVKLPNRDAKFLRESMAYSGS